MLMADQPRRVRSMRQPNSGECTVLVFNLPENDAGVQVPDCPAHFRAWIEEMANYVKKLDPNHLVSIGEEGFFGQDRPEAVHNPADWGGQIGQDFVLDHMPAAIDFATVHTWPDNWQR